MRALFAVGMSAIVLGLFFLSPILAYFFVPEVGVCYGEPANWFEGLMHGFTVFWHLIAGVFYPRVGIYGCNSGSSGWYNLWFFLGVSGSLSVHYNRN